MPREFSGRPTGVSSPQAPSPKAVWTGCLDAVFCAILSPKVVLEVHAIGFSAILLGRALRRGKAVHYNAGVADSCK